MNRKNVSSLSQERKMKETLQYLRSAAGNRASTKIEAVAMLTRFWLNTFYEGHFVATL